MPNAKKIQYMTEVAFQIREENMDHLRDHVKTTGQPMGRGITKAEVLISDTQINSRGIKDSNTF